MRGAMRGAGPSAPRATVPGAHAVGRNTSCATERTAEPEDEQNREGAGIERTRQQRPSPHTLWEITAKLRRVGELVGEGMLVTEAVRHVGVSDSTYYRWRAARRARAEAHAPDQGGPTSPDPDREQRLHRLEVENTRLRRALADVMIEKQALMEAATGLA